ncbi:MAG TPA: NUDIX hydrolase [Patescibacteria group bacterium]|nr:NUDIX hydrolase [Patescibacteria group bacterium]
MAKIKFGKLRTVFNGKIFRVKQQPVTLPDGSKTTYEYCERPASVSVLAFNDKNELLLIKENRVGYKHNVWFLPGGRADHHGDTPKKAAIRELREETGYRPKTIRLLQKKAPASTLIWDIYLFVAKDLVLDPLPKDKGEITKPYFVPLKKAVQMALDGTIENEFIAYDIIRFNEMVKRGEFKW